jgi:ribonucleotide monophosphatase NagD (HAD superfamily)
MTLSGEYIGHGAHKKISGKQLVFVTNNSTKSRADYKKKFDSMGISASEVHIPDHTLHCVRQYS